MKYEFQSNLREQISKRYVWTYTLNQLREKVSETLWTILTIGMAFFVAMYFGGHLIAQCLVNR